MSEQDIERVPDFQKWLGKKALAIKPLDYDVAPELGSLVLVFEARVDMPVGEITVSRTEYRFARPMPYVMEYLYTDGAYKLVGVGLVANRLQSPNYGAYLILLNDTIRDAFADTIPF